MKIRMATDFEGFKSPGSVVDYALAFCDLDFSDRVTSASVSVAPSGSGELVVDSVSLVAGFLVLVLSGGVAARQYQIKVDAGTFLGSTYEAVIGLSMDPLLATFPPPTPPSLGFGTPVTWPT